MSAPITIEDIIAHLQKGGENVEELNKQYAQHVEEHTCPLCKKVYKGYGNNPTPLKVKGQVCDECNATRVIPARMMMMFEDEKEEEEESDDDSEEESDDDSEDGFENCDCGYIHHYEDKCPKGKQCEMYEKWTEEDDDA